MSFERIHDRAQGRWKSLLPLLGIGAKYLFNKHGPCPMCVGKQSWRFDDKGGNGTWICTHCGAGNGVDLVMKFKNVDFLTAKKMIEEHVGVAPVVVPKASKSEQQRVSDQRDQMAHLWGRARPLDGEDLASRYLMARGIICRPWPLALKSIDDLPYWQDNTKALLPAMLAKFAAPDGKSAILHRTYLSEPGAKAAIEKPRQIMPGRMPPGGAVRLTAPAETMGIAEGIETALSAAILFQVPVWAALSAGALMKWQPPPEAKCILIFGDSDESIAGQVSAYGLAHRLKTEGYHVDVRLPAEIGTDWNDHMAVNGAAA